MNLESVKARISESEPSRILFYPAVPGRLLLNERFFFCLPAGEERSFHSVKIYKKRA